MRSVDVFRHFSVEERDRRVRSAGEATGAVDRRG